MVKNLIFDLVLIERSFCKKLVLLKDFYILELRLGQFEMEHCRMYIILQAKLMNRAK